MIRKPSFRNINWGDSDEVILRKIEKIRAKGTSIDLRDEYGRTILFDAIANERENIVSAILAMGASVDIEDNFGFSPLMYAVACKKESIYQNIVLKTKDVKAKEEALFFAIEHRCDEERIEDLIASRGVDVNARDINDATPLIRVVSAGNVENDWNKSLIKFLIKHNANPTLADRDGLTALGAAYGKLVLDKEVEHILTEASQRFVKSKQTVAKKTFKDLLQHIFFGRDSRC